jgi:hypothetical protein
MLQNYLEFQDLSFFGNRKEIMDYNYRYDKIISVRYVHK